MTFKQNRVSQFSSCDRLGTTDCRTPSQQHVGMLGVLIDNLNPEALAHRVLRRFLNTLSTDLSVVFSSLVLIGSKVFVPLHVHNNDPKANKAVIC